MDCSATTTEKPREKPLRANCRTLRELIRSQTDPREAFEFTRSACRGILSPMNSTAQSSANPLIVKCRPGHARFHSFTYLPFPDP